MKEAAARPVPIPVYAEMSALNPLVILPSALAGDGAAVTLAEKYFGSLTLGVGQFCTNPGLVILPADGSDEFLAKLAELVDSGSAGVMLNQGIANSYAEAIDLIGKVDGVKQLAAAKSDLGGDGFTAKPTVFVVSARVFHENAEALQVEAFGPGALLITAAVEEMVGIVERLEGQLTATIHGSEEEIAQHEDLLSALRNSSGRLIFNVFPTGVEVCSSMVHGGPYPATSDGRTSSVGTLAVFRFCRQAAWQDAPTCLLPEARRD
jgi:NADP-dependent aldehyde dehydrogenase